MRKINAMCVCFGRGPVCVFERERCFFFLCDVFGCFYSLGWALSFALKRFSRIIHERLEERKCAGERFFCPFLFLLFCLLFECVRFSSTNHSFVSRAA